METGDRDLRQLPSTREKYSSRRNILAVEMDPLQLMSLYGPVGFHYYRDGKKKILLLSDLHYKDQHCDKDYHVVDWLHDLSRYQPLDLYVESDYWLNPGIFTNYTNQSPLVDLLNSNLSFSCIDLRSIKYLKNNRTISLISFNHSDQLVRALLELKISQTFNLDNIDLGECIKYLMCITRNQTHYYRLYRGLYLYALNEDIEKDYLREYMAYYRQIVIPIWKILYNRYDFDRCFYDIMMKRVSVIISEPMTSENIYLLVKEIGNIPIHYYGLMMMITSPLHNIVCYAGQNHINFYREFFEAAMTLDPVISIENNSRLDEMRADQCIRFSSPFNYFSEEL